MRQSIHGPTGLVAAVQGIVLSTAWCWGAGAPHASASEPSTGEPLAGEQRAPADSSAATALGGKPRAAQLVAAALDAEALAELDRRVELLRQAVTAAADFSAAHWHLGEVRLAGRWMSIEDAAEQARRDESLGEYRQLRADFADDAEAHLVLARWCQKHQMTAEARAHAVRLLALRPDSTEAIKMLGLAWHEGMLLTPEQLAQHKVRAEKAKQALKYWRPRLEELRRKIESAASADHEEGLRELGAIADSSAIEALESVFKNRREMAGELVRIIGKIPGPEATDWLLRQSMLSKREDVRLAACRQLRDRPLHGYVPKLMGALSTPLQARVDVVRDGHDIRFRQTVQRSGATANFEKTIETDVTTIVPNPNLGGLVGAVYAQTFLSAKKTEKALESTNRKLIEFNESIYWVLDRTTDQPLPHQPEPWWTWWQDYNQLTDTPKQTIATTFVQAVDVPYVPYVPPEMLPSTHHGCFAKGTKVWTLTGPLAIEEIRVGDRVLAQDPLSGELDYKPVLQTTLGNQPMIAIDVDNEQVVATKGHVFWVSGLGWRMAKNLKVGDRLHDVSGWTEIKALKDVAADETHNLVVADFGTYFVGDSRIFVHDITMLQPTTALVPGQAQR